MPEPVVFSYSELDAWRQCEFKHQLAYFERWQQQTKSPALQRGSDWHTLMATFYGERQAGTPWKLSAKRAWRQHCIPAEGAQTPEQSLLEWMLIGYIEFWQGDRTWRIEEVEVQHVVPISEDFALKIQADLIVRLPNNRLWLVDCKTGKNLPRLEEFQMHVQFPLYTWALRRIGIPIWGTIYDGVRTHRNKEKPQPLDERFRRLLLHHTDQELEVVVRDALRDMRMARRTLRALQIQERRQARSEERPVLPVDVPRHPDAQTCRWRCDFYQACMAGMRSPDTRTSRRYLQDSGFEQHFERH